MPYTKHFLAIAQTRHNNNGATRKDNLRARRITLTQMTLFSLYHPITLYGHVCGLDQDELRNHHPTCSAFNLLTRSVDLYLPETFNFKHVSLNDSDNFTCTYYCQVKLWKEERHIRFNCCGEGRLTSPRLTPPDDNLNNLFYDSQSFKQSQLKSNSLVAFTALGAGGLQKRTHPWTNPSRPSMLTLHGRAYHSKLFDLNNHTNSDIKYLKLS